MHEKVARKIGRPKPPFVSTSFTNAVPLSQMHFLFHKCTSPPSPQQIADFCFCSGFWTPIENRGKWKWHIWDLKWKNETSHLEAASWYTTTIIHILCAPPFWKLHEWNCQIFHGQQIKINEALSPHITHGNALVFARRHGGSCQWKNKHMTQEMKLARFQSIFWRDTM